jgi:glycosyltransferase involved in cell wall biosynthesis
MFLGKTIAVVVPAYNEERLLPRVIAEMPSYVDTLIVVDDASSDATASVAAASERPVVLLRHAHNRGVGAAIATGYLEALRRDADVIAVMGGDAQMDPEELSRLVAPVAQGGADYAKGDRLSHPGARRLMPLWRFLGGRALTVLTRLTSGYWKLRDSQCGFTAISREALERIPLHRLYPRYGYPNDLLGWLNALGLRLHQEPVRPIYGCETSGIHPLRIIPRLLYVLGRSFGLRLWHKYLRRLFSDVRAPVRGLLR